MKDFNYNLIGLADPELKIYMILISIILHEDQSKSMARQFTSFDSINAISSKLSKVTAYLKPKIETLLSLAASKLGKKAISLETLSKEFGFVLSPTVQFINKK